MKKSELKSLIKECLLEESMSSEDYSAASKLQPKLEKALKGLEDAFNLIDKNLSKANSPGLSAAFTQAINEGRPSATAGGKFDYKKAVKQLSRWYDQ